jgi:hypothetical protein
MIRITIIWLTFTAPIENNNPTWLWSNGSIFFPNSSFFENCYVIFNSTFRSTNKIYCI